MSQSESQKSAETPVVLVTGASRGLGRGIARALARDGKSVAVHFASNRAAAEETVLECQKCREHPAQRFVAVGGNIGDAADRARVRYDILKTRIELLRTNASTERAAMSMR